MEGDVLALSGAERERLDVLRRLKPASCDKHGQRSFWASAFGR